MVYAKSSAAEVRSQLYIGMEIDFIDKASGKEWIQATERIGAMLTSLIKKKREFATQAGETPAPYETP